MDAALKRSRSEEPAELLQSARDLEEEEEEGMEQELEEEEEVDPRIQGELEKLNQSTDDINRRETELESPAEVFMKNESPLPHSFSPPVQLLEATTSNVSSCFF